MTAQTRMSPLTALFIGLFGVGGVIIACSSAIVLYSMAIIDSRASEILGLADTTVEKTVDALPQILESLPPAIEDLHEMGRAPEYVDQLDVGVDFVVDSRSKGLRPVLTIVNRGDRVVSMLAVRVAALNESGLPIREWTEVVATPIAICDEWRGTLFPGATRHVVLSSGWRGIPIEKARNITGAAEISEIRLWNPTDPT